MATKSSSSTVSRHSWTGEGKKALADTASKLTEVFKAGDETKHVALEIGRLLLHAYVLESSGEAIFLAMSDRKSSV